MNNNDFKPDSEVAPMPNMINKTNKFGLGEEKTMTFTPAELMYKLFRRKNCPVCMSKMKQNKKKEYKGIGRVGERGSGGSRGDGHIYEYTQWYFCERCNHNYSIGELVEINKERKKRK